MTPGRFLRWLAGPGLALLLTARAADAANPIRYARIYDDGQPHATSPVSQDPLLVHRVWPFCPTDRSPCSERELAWVELGISLDVYSTRRNDDHASIVRIVKETETDLAPLTAALQDYFRSAGVSSDVRRVAFVQGLVEGVQYGEDEDTGWPEYPKFGLEFFVDQVGDCDDAAIAATVLLRGLGYDSWFVEWTGPEEGHLSTAVTPDRGDLKTFQPPPDSQWISAPDGAQLLHADATSIPSGCGRPGVGCGGVGWNEWSKQGLTVHAVVRADDPALAIRIPIQAWDTQHHLKRADRRGTSDKAIRDETMTRYDPNRRVRQGLHHLGLSPRQVDHYLYHRWYSSTALFYSYIAFCLGLVGAISWKVWRDRVERERRAAVVRQRRLEERP